jgi:hypothetical protein
MALAVIPANAGIQEKGLVPDFRRDDVWTPASAGETTQDYGLFLKSLRHRTVNPLGVAPARPASYLGFGEQCCLGGREKKGWR